jgi:hypothetical protein
VPNALRLTRSFDSPAQADAPSAGMANAATAIARILMVPPNLRSSCEPDHTKTRERVL